MPVGSSGTLQIGTGANPARDPFTVRLTYTRTSADRARVRIETTPRANLLVDGTRHATPMEAILDLRRQSSALLFEDPDTGAKLAVDLRAVERWRPRR